MESNGKANGNGHDTAAISGIETFALPRIDPKFNLPIWEARLCCRPRSPLPGIEYDYSRAAWNPF
jgi:hypothetical protein